jgi:hypothetical protein
MKNVTLTTGSAVSSEKRRLGGRATMLRYGSHCAELSRQCVTGTELRREVFIWRLEIEAVIDGLRLLNEPCEVLLISNLICPKIDISWVCTARTDEVSGTNLITIWYLYCANEG